MNLANKNKICQCIIYVQCLKQKQNKTKVSEAETNIFQTRNVTLLDGDKHYPKDWYWHLSELFSGVQI